MKIFYVVIFLFSSLAFGCHTYGTCDYNTDCNNYYNQDCVFENKNKGKNWGSAYCQGATDTGIKKGIQGCNGLCQCR